MSHTHDHSGKNLWTAFVLNLIFAIVELVGGIFTNSVAILADALHDFGDSLSLGLAWYLHKVSKRGRDEAYSYGYIRFSILGALISSLVLILGSVFILVETIPRLMNPVRPDTSGMIVLALIGLVVNGYAAIRLHKGVSLTERAVYLHMLEDVLGWAATLLGAVIMHLTDFAIIDATLSILIALFILYNVWKNVKKGFAILLQGTPTNLNMQEVHEILRTTDGVIDFHDCHAWTMDGQYHVLSVHLVVKNQSMEALEKLKGKVKTQLIAIGIRHATIEFEAEDSPCIEC
mgnify:CR=1 FL=1